jgi:hypothetical protein
MCVHREYIYWSKDLSSSQWRPWRPRINSSHVPQCCSKSSHRRHFSANDYVLKSCLYSLKNTNEHFGFQNNSMSFKMTTRQMGSTCRRWNYYSPHFLFEKISHDSKTYLFPTNKEWNGVCLGGGREGLSCLLQIGQTCETNKCTMTCVKFMWNGQLFLVKYKSSPNLFLVTAVIMKKSKCTLDFDPGFPGLIGLGIHA